MKTNVTNKLGVPFFPPRINVEPTNNCNMTCVMCPHSKMSREKGFMDMQLFQKLINECASYDTKLWLHLLGEPFLHPDIFEMIKYSRGKKIKEVGLATNGVLMGEDISKKIIVSGLNRLECSLDAVTSGGYEKIRKGGSYDKLANNIRFLLQLKRKMKTKSPIVSLQFVKIKITESFLDECYSLWKDYLNEEDFIMTIEYSSFAGQLSNKLSSATPGITAISERKSCRWLWKGTVVMYNGDVTICGGDYEGRSVLGNIKEQSLQSIWTGEKYNALRLLHHEKDFTNAGLCATCDEWMYGDGSRYKNRIESN